MLALSGKWQPTVHYWHSEVLWWRTYGSQQEESRVTLYSMLLQIFQWLPLLWWTEESKGGIGKICRTTKQPDLLHTNKWQQICGTHCHSIFSREPFQAAAACAVITILYFLPLQCSARQSGVAVREKTVKVWLACWLLDKFKTNNFRVHFVIGLIDACL